MSKAPTNDWNTKRKHNRGPFLSGVSRYDVPFEDDSWYKKETKPLLTAHYKCEKPGPVRCIMDVDYMMKTGYAKITASRTTKEDKLPAFKLPEAVLGQVREWREDMAAGDDAEEFAHNC